MRGSAKIGTVMLLAGLAGTAGAVDFAHEVVPLLKKHCGECHTGDARQGGFSMNTREDLLAGGDSGTPGLVAGKAAESEIIRRVVSDDPDYRMPSEGKPLPPEAVAVLKRWVDEQAPREPTARRGATTARSSAARASTSWACCPIPRGSRHSRPTPIRGSGPASSANCSPMRFPTPSIG
jgi:mono/diheme cytochrome c family protein